MCSFCCRSVFLSLSLSLPLRFPPLFLSSSRFVRSVCICPFQSFPVSLFLLQSLPIYGDIIYIIIWMHKSIVLKCIQMKRDFLLLDQNKPIHKRTQQKKKHEEIDSGVRVRVRFDAMSEKNKLPKWQYEWIWNEKRKEKEIIEKILLPWKSSWWKYNINNNSIAVICLCHRIVWV